jgi:hypothetical protein
LREQGPREQQGMGPPAATDAGRRPQKLRPYTLALVRSTPGGLTSCLSATITMAQQGARARPNCGASLLRAAAVVQGNAWWTLPGPLRWRSTTRCRSWWCARRVGSAASAPLGCSARAAVPVDSAAATNPACGARGFRSPLSTVERDTERDNAKRNGEALRATRVGEGHRGHPADRGGATGTRCHCSDRRERPGHRRAGQPGQDRQRHAEEPEGSSQERAHGDLSAQPSSGRLLR